MTPLRKYGTSLLDQEIGIGAQAERDRRATQVRSEAQVAKADAGDFRRARRAYRRAMRNEDTGMAAMALRGMEAFGSAKSAAHGIQSAGWADRVGENNVTRYEFEARKENAIRAKESAEFGISSGSSFAKRAEATAPSSSQAGQSFAERADGGAPVGERVYDRLPEGSTGGVWVDVSGNKRPLEDEERRPSYSDSLESRRGAAQDMIREYRSAKQAGGKVDKGSFLRRAQEIGLGSGLGPGFADRIEKLFDSAVARQERADMESSAAKRRAAEDARAASGAMTGRERGRWAVDRMGFQGAAEDYFKNRSPLAGLNKTIAANNQIAERLDLASGLQQMIVTDPRMLLENRAENLDAERAFRRRERFARGPINPNSRLL